MDYKGQGRAEFLYQAIIGVFTLIGVAYGYSVQYFFYVLLAHAIGVCVASLICLPPWPIFKRNPTKWQKAVEVPTSDDATATS